MSRALIVSELGVNHNGSRRELLRLVRAASLAECDAVKIQMRTPELHARDIMRESCTAEPGEMISELEHRRRMELTDDDLAALDDEARHLGLAWFGSCWDLPSVERAKRWAWPYWKIASASLYDLDLVRAVREAADETGATVMASTGMSMMEDVDAAMRILGTERTILMHCVSDYPMANGDAGLLTMLTLRERYGVPVGWSGHERGLQISTVAAVMPTIAEHVERQVCERYGITRTEMRRRIAPSAVERHLTTDRAMRGSDHAASLEPAGMTQLVRDIRVLEAAMGDGVKRITPGEVKQRERLRRSA